jgi:hypothetical protein
MRKNKIPDEIYFGINTKGESITFGYVRNITDENELIKLLELRLRRFFIDQTQILQDKRSAFPLCIMTCIGIETLGNIFIEENKDDRAYRFNEISSKMDQLFGRPIKLSLKEKFIAIWKNNEFKTDSYGKLLYRLLRNTMIHGYHIKGYYLSYESTKDINIDEENAIIKINPDWFWNTFKNTFDKIFIETLKAQSNNRYRINCLKYIKKELLA